MSIKETDGCTGGLSGRIASRRTLLRTVASAAVAGAMFNPNRIMAAINVNPGRELSFLNLHTGERLKAEYWYNGQYNRDALQSINHVLRDWRTDAVHTIDPALLDLIHVLHDKVRSSEPFHVICGYRSPETNAMLHERSGAVAKHSMHIEGKAIDIRLPGLGLKYLQQAALSLKAGGVGYYPSDDFVHVDTGPLRKW